MGPPDCWSPELTTGILYSYRQMYAWRGKRVLANSLSATALKLGTSSREVMYWQRGTGDQSRREVTCQIFSCTPSESTQYLRPSQQRH